MNKAGRMLKTEKISDICEERFLTRMEVYNIRSQFAGLCLMSKEDEQREQAALRAAQDGGKGGKAGKKGKGGAIDGAGDAQDEGRALGIAGRQQEGIGLSFFKKNCSFLAGCQGEIVERILVASGLDIESANTVIDWGTYLDLYCIFEAGGIDKKKLITFWIKFFDRTARGAVPEKEYLPVLEQLVRGNALKDPSATTKLFAEMFQTMMEKAGCLDESRAIVNEKLADAFEKEAIDIQLLCSALGRQ